MGQESPGLRGSPGIRVRLTWRNPQLIVTDDPDYFAFLCVQCKAEVILPFLALAYPCTCPLCYGLTWLPRRAASDAASLVWRPRGTEEPVQ